MNFGGALKIYSIALKVNSNAYDVEKNSKLGSPEEGRFIAAQLVSAIVIPR